MTDMTALTVAHGADLTVGPTDGLDSLDVAGARDWYLAAARAGDVDAMVKLVVLLGDRDDPPDLDAARYWSEKAACAGDPSAWFRLGALRAGRGDREGTEQAWRRVIDAADDAQAAGLAALGLAALAALDDAADMAWPLLQVASACGFGVARMCAASLAADQGGRRAALAWLAEREDEPGALTFVGLAAYRDGTPAAATGHWRRSARAGDPAAALLLHLTATSAPQLPRRWGLGRARTRR
jgi:TPR repeat protein